MHFNSNLTVRERNVNKSLQRVCPPLALMTARHIRHINPIRRMQIVCGMLFHSSVSAL